MGGKFLLMTLGLLAGPVAVGEPAGIPGDKEPEATSGESGPAPGPADVAGAEEAGSRAEEPVPAEEESNLKGLLEGLGHEEFQKRRVAQEALLAWGREDLTPRIETLFQAYRQSEEPEIRLRTREVLKRLVIEKQPWGGKGYLGIQMQASQIKGADGGMRPVVLVTEVRVGTAAKEAGVQVGDLILAVDGRTFKEVDARLPFGQYIQSKRPGETVRLSIRREDEDLEIKSGLRRRSPILDRITPFGLEYNLPDQADLDEGDFREWLSHKEAAEKGGGRPRGAGKNSTNRPK